MKVAQEISERDEIYKTHIREREKCAVLIFFIDGVEVGSAERIYDHGLVRREKSSEGQIKRRGRRRRGYWRILFLLLLPCYSIASFLLPHCCVSLFKRDPCSVVLRFILVFWYFQSRFARTERERENAYIKDEWFFSFYLRHRIDWSVRVGSVKPLFALLLGIHPCVAASSRIIKN